MLAILRERNGLGGIRVRARAGEGCTSCKRKAEKGVSSRQSKVQSSRFKVGI